MLHVMGNLSEDYKATITDLENRLMAKRDEKHTIKMTQAKLNARYK